MNISAPYPGLLDLSESRREHRVRQINPAASCPPLVTPSVSLVEEPLLSCMYPVPNTDRPPVTGPRRMLVHRWVGPAPNAGRLWGNFPSYDAIGRLEAPMDFMNSVGVLLPMELWGRCVLYSCLNASHFTWASANDKNQF
jgi:hypothetical protein